MAWWNTVFGKIADFFVPSRRLPDRKPRRGRKAKATGPVEPRKLPGRTGGVSRGTQQTEDKSEYLSELNKLRSEQQQKRALENVMFDDKRPDKERKEALERWATLTGWWRPINNAEWSNEEWKRWEEIYESEPEVF